MKENKYYIKCVPVCENCHYIFRFDEVRYIKDIESVYGLYNKIASFQKGDYSPKRCPQCGCILCGIQIPSIESFMD